MDIPQTTPVPLQSVTLAKAVCANYLRRQPGLTEARLLGGASGLHTVATVVYFGGASSPFLACAVADLLSPELPRWMAKDFPPSGGGGGLARGANFRYVVTDDVAGERAVFLVPFLGNVRAADGGWCPVACVVTNEETVHFELEHLHPSSVSLWTSVEARVHWTTNWTSALRSHCGFPVPTLPTFPPDSWHIDPDDSLRINQMALRYGSDVLWAGQAHENGGTDLLEAAAFVKEYLLQADEVIESPTHLEASDFTGGYAWARVKA